MSSAPTNLMVENAERVKLFGKQIGVMDEVHDDVQKNFEALMKAHRDATNAQRRATLPTAEQHYLNYMRYRKQFEYARHQADDLTGAHHDLQKIFQELMKTYRAIRLAANALRSSNV
jgi:hypothetical protein